MATETYAKPQSKPRWYPRWTWKALAALVALAVLSVVVIVEVVEPLSMGLPIGWDHYDDAALHFRVGTPPLWNVVADSDLFQSDIHGSSCGFAVGATPPSETAQSSTLTLAKSLRWMSVISTAPCLEGGSPDPKQAALWQPTGQYVSIAGIRAPIEVETIGAPQVSYRASVTLHGYSYDFLLNELSEVQAQRDMPDFLTMARSFRYINV